MLSKHFAVKTPSSVIKSAAQLILLLLLLSGMGFGVYSPQIAEARGNENATAHLVSPNTVATASAYLSQNPPVNAIDQNLTTSWNAGAFPTQWIELDLGVTTSISQIRLLINQSPSPATTTHQIYAGSSPNPATLRTTFTGTTVQKTWLTASFSPALSNIRYIRVKTTASPSWVSWYEIEVYGVNLNKISVRQVSGAGEFYDTVTNQKFVPRGNNYIRLASQNCPNPITYHSTFDASWNIQAIDAALTKMKDDGYNVVRVFINDCAVGNSAGSGLSSQYMTRVKDFLNKAKEKKDVCYSHVPIYS